MTISQEQDGDRDERGFVVIDRRASSGAADEPSPRTEPQQASERDSAAAESPKTPPPVDFAMLVQSFFVTAMHHLGELPDPETGERARPQLALARQNIEILEVIEAKTRGNLDEDEKRLLDGLLYEIRMHFVEASKAPPR